jgi:hypothetical protein
MRRSRVFIAMLALGVTLAGAVNAQSHPTRPEGAYGVPGSQRPTAAQQRPTDSVGIPGRQR